MTLDLHHVQNQIRAFRRELDLHPLASFRCWERVPVEGEEVDPERFSQIDTVRALQDHKTVVVWGGSRSAHSCLCRTAMLRARPRSLRSTQRSKRTTIPATNFWASRSTCCRQAHQQPKH